MSRRLRARARDRGSRLKLEKLFPEYSPDFWEGVLLFDDMDEAFVGLATQFTKDPVAVYDYDGCLACLRSWGMTHEEAEEYFSFNTVGAWIGERTPMILRFRDDRRGGVYETRALFLRAAGTKDGG